MTERLAMARTREILRQKLQLDLSHREVARSAAVSAGTVGALVTRAKAAGLDWDAITALSDDELEERLHGPRASATSDDPDRTLPDPQYLHRELRRKGVTLQLLHLEYREQHPGGFGYTKFCEVYREWLGCRSPSMRQVHVAGDKCFVDFSGAKPSIVDADTGEVIEVDLFVSALGASSYTFARATRTQQVPDWVAVHVEMFEFYEGVSTCVVPDQLRSGVTAPCRYEPAVQRTYAEMAEHYGTAIVPARPGKPRDKAKAEAAVKVAQRWILARLRNQTFFSLVELNARIDELRDDLNARPMRAYGMSRREMFDRYERSALKRLPDRRYECAEWKWPRVNIDYHVEFDRHLYSVPSDLIHQQVEIRATTTVVEILLDRKRIVAHVRSYKRGGYTTKPEHMPAAHRAHAEWSPSRLIGWATTIGPSTAALVESILASRRHPEHGYRSCLGLLRLSKRYGHDRLEAACVRALGAGARSYKHVASILEHRLDQVSDGEPVTTTLSRPTHENVRGRNYYH
jgi:transposase